jgi:hypothetical protein
VAGLLPVVQLAQEALAQLFEDGRELVAAARLGVRVEELGDVGEHVEVFRHLLADVRALHLDDDGAAVPHPRAVHLPERGGGDGPGLELGERLRDADAQLGRDDLLDLGEGERLDLVLEARERVEVGLRQEVGPRREQLRELDEGRPHPLDVGRKLLQLRRLYRLLALGRGALDGLLQPRVLHEVAPPVLHQQRRDVFVTFEMFGFEREAHKQVVRRQ